MTATRQRTSKLCDLGKRVVYLTSTDKIKIGTRGEPHVAAALPQHATKGELRSIRKGLRAHGRMDLLNATLRHR